MEIMKDPSEIRNFEFKQLLKDNNINTLDELYSFLYPYDFSPDNIIIRKRWFDTPKTTMLNRFNSIWVFPIFFVCIPIRYILYGNFYVNKESKLGKILKSLLGEY